MDDKAAPSRDTAALADQLIAQVEAAREKAKDDPFGNPVLSVALNVQRLIDQGLMSPEQIDALIRFLRDTAFRDRARRLAAYVAADRDTARADIKRLAARLARPDPRDSPVPWSHYASTVERTRFAAVFTAHPTFAVAEPVFAALAATASGRKCVPEGSHRPGPITLENEFQQAVAAISRGRDALDALTLDLLEQARETWPDRWTSLCPRPVILSSWVGYDTDGRTDIHWWDTLRLRLTMKRLQLERLHAQLLPLEVQPLTTRVQQALAAVADQLDACPDKEDAEQTACFARTLVEKRDVALATPEPLLAPFASSIAAARPEEQRALCVVRAGLLSHGLGLAHTHVRLNAAQVHNAIRQRLGLNDPPEDRARRRALLSEINKALDEVESVAVDFGSLMVEQASAVRLMMTVAQIRKFVDSVSPIRFLIAETETGYTLLSALWLARLFGVEDGIEISPLFETADALERGAHVLDEALRSPHYRDYLCRTGRLAVQFGYSDSGRYVGQLAASYLIERLRLKVRDLLTQHDITGVEVVFFDTHGESIGRGAHPGNLADRLKYLSPTAAWQEFNRAGLAVREESAFQGGDGYLLFGTPELALATIARIVEHCFGDAARPIEDPVYADPDFASDFFATIRASMSELVEDPGYAALLGAFGPALLDSTGSRPAARQVDGIGGPRRIQHPRELRAIPNNAILQQLGWCANTLHGLGAAAARHPETFQDFMAHSRRFRRAIDLAAHGLLHSDLDVLRGVVASLDPGSWLDRAADTERPGRREALVGVARGLERLGLWASVQAMFRRIQADLLSLRAVWPDLPAMAPREVVLHALRLALIHRIWLLATTIPDFSPRHGVTRMAVEARMLQLDIPATQAILAEVFPALPDPAADRDYFEPHGPRATDAYIREHRKIFEPIGRLFNQIREIATAITHEVGAFG